MLNSNNLIKIDKEDFENEFQHEFDVHYVENEGNDLRIDLSEDLSLWLRNESSVEGCLPKRYRKKVNTILEKLQVQNDVVYL